MPKQHDYEMPKGVVVDEASRTSTYARMIAEPFEVGFGHTLGNALRRVLLASPEGAAITTVKIEGVSHEFSTIPGVYDDVTHIILNLKKVLFKVVSRKPFKCTLKATKPGEVTAGMIHVPMGVEVINKDLYLCLIDSPKTTFECELTVEVGRGYRPAELNKKPNLPLGVIPVDSRFSPVAKVKYAIEAARVGMKTDYDRLVLEVTTDGRIDPVAVTVQSADLLDEHIALFRKAGEPMYLEGSSMPEEEAAPEKKAVEREKGAVAGAIEDSGLSKRTVNALVKAQVMTISDLAQRTERELLGLAGFGQKAIVEVKEILAARHLDLKREPATEAEIAALMKKTTAKKK